MFNISRNRQILNLKPIKTSKEELGSETGDYIFSQVARIKAGEILATYEFNFIRNSLLYEIVNRLHLYSVSY